MTKKLKRRKKDYPMEIKVDSLINNFSINEYKKPKGGSQDPLEYMIKKESFARLSREAKFVISLIIWSPLDLFASTKTTIDDALKYKKGGMRIIKSFLVKRVGLWPFQATKVIDEIKDFSKNF